MPKKKKNLARRAVKKPGTTKATRNRGKLTTDSSSDKSAAEADNTDSTSEPEAVSTKDTEAEKVPRTPGTTNVPDHRTPKATLGKCFQKNQ